MEVKTSNVAVAIKFYFGANFSSVNEPLNTTITIIFFSLIFLNYTAKKELSVRTFFLLYLSKKVGGIK
jgi:hypothetical protein